MVILKSQRRKPQSVKDAKFACHPGKDAQRFGYIKFIVMMKEQTYTGYPSPMTNDVDVPAAGHDIVVIR